LSYRPPVERVPVEHGVCNYCLLPIAIRRLTFCDRPGRQSRPAAAGHGRGPRPKLRWEMGKDIAEGAGIGKAQCGLGRGEALFGLDRLHASRLETRGLEQCTHIDRVDTEDDALTRPGVGAERRLAQRRHHHLLEGWAITLQVRADAEPTAAT